MASETKKQKELRQPDALQRAGLEASSWVESKEKFILGGLVAVLVIGLGIALVDYLGSRGERRAQGELGAALTPVMRPVQEGAAPQADASQVEAEKPFASQKEKDEAIVASLSKFRADHKGKAASVTAALPLAQAQYRLGKYDEALATFDDYLKGASKDDPLRAAALEGKGYTYEAKGDLQKAAAAYDELANLGGTQFLEGMGRFHKARLLILEGKKDEAAKALAEIPAAYPNSAAARLAAERMNVLASQGVAVPPPQAPKSADTGSAG